MGEHRSQFQSRLKHINRKHAALAAGYSARMQPDGLLVAKPHRPVARAAGRRLIYVLAAFVLCKGALIGALGTGSYDARLTRLSQGSGLEQLGAIAMQRDPVSMFLAQQIAPFLS